MCLRLKSLLPSLLLFALAAPAAHAAVIMVPVTTASAPVYAVGSGVAGDQRLFIVEKTGKIRILHNGSLLGTPFLDITGKISNGGEQGLLSMAFHPDYASNGAFYVNYTNVAGNTIIERYLVSADPNVANAGSAKLLLEIAQPFSNHNGGQLQIGPNDGHLYIGMGDGGSFQDPQCVAQQKNTLLGKMLRLDVRKNFNTAPYYGIPAGNPFTGANDPSNQVADEIWALGLRNPWRFSFDRATSDLWIADVGQSGWEEVDFTPSGTAAGVNYGWKIMEGNACNIDGACPASTPACGSSAYNPPVHVYPHDNQGNCSITGGYRYRGTRTPELAGKYLYGDYCTGRLWTLTQGPGNTWTNAFLSQPGNGLTSFGQDNQGELYAIFGSTVYKVASDAPPPPAVPASRTTGIALLAALLMALGGAALVRGKPWHVALATLCLTLGCGDDAKVASQFADAGAMDVAATTGQTDPQNLDAATQGTPSVGVDAGSSDGGGADVLVKARGLCERCENRSQCGAADNDCIRVEETGEHYCSRDCRTRACPKDFKCVSLLGTNGKQCVPATETCEGVPRPVLDP